MQKMNVCSPSGPTDRRGGRERPFPRAGSAWLRDPLLSTRSLGSSVRKAERRANGNYNTGEFLEGIAIADFDGDNDPDLAVPNIGPDNVSVLLNNEDGTFAAAANYGVGDEPMVIAIGDLDGDTDADVAATNFSSHNVSVLLNNGDGTFAAANYDVGDDSPTR
jgi:hypothetical protein